MKLIYSYKDPDGTIHDCFQDKNEIFIDSQPPEVPIQPIRKKTSTDTMSSIDKTFIPSTAQSVSAHSYIRPVITISLPLIAIIGTIIFSYILWPIVYVEGTVVTADRVGTVVLYAFLLTAIAIPIGIVLITFSVMLLKQKNGFLRIVLGSILLSTTLRYILFVVGELMYDIPETAVSILAILSYVVPITLNIIINIIVACHRR